MKSPSSFIAITSEGGLLPADFLHELPDPKTSIEGVTPVAYHLAEGERLNEQINRSWNRLKGCWENFKKAVVEKPAGESTTTDTREHWLLPLFQELGFGRVTTAKPIEVDGRSYPVSHGWNQVPIHLVGSHADLDLRTPGAIGAAKASPHSLVQSALNASDAHLWGIASNGLNLRLLRDNVALTRLAYVEFDLQAMFDGDLYSEFFVLWLVCHQSRFEGEKPAQYFLERWKKSSEDKTLRALDDLYPGVKKAIAALGSGLVSHPGNTALREKLRTGKLTTQEFYRQVLRVIYRMLFQLVAEDRDLLHPPFIASTVGAGPSPTGVGEGARRADEGRPGENQSSAESAALKARRRYLDFYSIARLRSLTLYRSGTPHPDLWHVFQFVTAKLGSDTGCPELALPPLGSFLWSAAQSTPDLLDSLISNRHFLEAVHAIAFVQDGNVRRAVDYKNLGSEELGSVYQGLLEMHPRINADAGSFELDTAAGNERKTSGSYYTPDSLVQCLLDSALEPVIAERLAEARAKASKSPKAAKTSPSPPSEGGEGRGEVGSSLTYSQLAEQAILSLKVCDMAAGSGHFIIRAGHRIARHLARVRSGEEEPSPRVYQTALRDVIGHCLYGVDINPMAVELCKVTLWLEALEPGKPLSFLDHHIRCGNSLLGATPELIAAGLPDDAFEAIEGDDKSACASLKKLNRAQREGLRHMFIAEDTAIRERLHQAAAAIDEIKDNLPEDIHRKEAAFRSAQTNYDFGKAWDLANLWCAAFVIKKHFAGGADSFSPTGGEGRDEGAKSAAATLNDQPLVTQGGLFGGSEELPKTKGKKAKASSHASSEIPIGITTQNLRDFVEGGVLPDGLLAEAKRLADQFQFFHFHLAFPEVFAQGGFDASLGNPPWERTAFEAVPYFVSRVPEIAKAETTSKRESLIAKLPESDPNIWATYQNDLRSAEGSDGFYCRSGRFPFSASGRTNTFALFTELALNASSIKGRVGLIVPSALATDTPYSAFWGDIMENRCLISMFDFENRGIFFPNVHRSYKFSLFTFRPVSDPTVASLFGFFLDDLSDVRSTSKTFTLRQSDVAAINPITKLLPVCRTVEDFLLLAMLHKRSCLLNTEATPWVGLTSSATSSNWHFNLDENSPELGFSPMWEAKCIHQFNHRFSTYAGTTREKKLEGEPAGFQELTNPNAAIVTRYHIPSSVWSNHLDGRQVFISGTCGYRDVARSTDERTIIAAIVPFAGFMQPLNGITHHAPDKLLRLVGCLNSFVLDFAGRQKTPGTHVNVTICKQLPIIAESQYERLDSIFDKNACAWFLQRVLELTYTAWDLEAFAQDCGWSGPPFRWDEERRFLLRCELDAAFFHLYLGPETDWRQQPAALTQAFPTPRAAVAYILDTFPIVKRKDEAKFNGDYRTKRVILETYDALAASMQTGHPYQTRLNPPPADPRCCHPPKT